MDNGTAIICGTGHIQKDSIKSTYESSNVLVKREGDWKAILSHVSGVRDINWNIKHATLTINHCGFWTKIENNNINLGLIS